MGMIARLAVLCIAAAPVSAGELPALSCRGDNWSLALNWETATFEHDKVLEMTVPQYSVAEGHDWPVAVTLISDFDTAIAIIDKRQCQANGVDAFYTAEVLTQRGTVPVLLTGCCMVLE